jgi:hypothetical protein
VTARPVDEVAHAVAALRDDFARGAAPRVALLSRFGTDFLGDAFRARPVEVARLDGRGRLLARRATLGGVPLLSLESDVDGESEPFDEALPLLVAGQLGVRRAVALFAAGALVAPVAVPSIVAVRDWIRWSDGDPLRAVGAERLGARFPDLRGVASERAGAIAAELFPRVTSETVGSVDGVVAVARRGPSGATDAELALFARLGGEVVVEGCGAELVAARHQGVELASIALVLDAAHGTPADPGSLAESAGTLLPRLAQRLPELARRLAEEST